MEVVDERPHQAEDRDTLEPTGQSDPATGAGQPPTRGQPVRRFLVSRHAADAVLALLLFVAALAWFSLTLDRTFNLTDEGYLLRMGQRVAQGELPHRDFVEDYGPGVFVAIGAIWQQSDGEILFVRRAIAAWKAFAVILGFLLARRMSPRWVAFGVGLLSIVYWGRASLNVNAPHAALMTVPLCMAATLTLIVAMQGGCTAPEERRRKALLALAGAIGGAAVLFKQSLGVMNAYGMGLALIALAMTGLDPGFPRASATTEKRDGERARKILLAAWAVMAVFLLVPGFAYLGPREYLIHFLPIHALMACVALALLRRRDDAPRPWAVARHRLGPLALGAAIPLGLVALFHLQSGHLDDLLIGMFERPLRRRNYAIPALAPPASISVFVIGLASCGAAAGLQLGQRSRWAKPLAAVGVALVALAVLFIPHSNPRLYTPRVMLRSATIFDWVLHSATLLTAVAVFGPRWIKRAGSTQANSHDRVDPPDPESERLRAVLPLAFFSGLLCFQIFPRGAHNVWMAQAAWMPLLGVTLHELGRRWTRTAPRPRRLAVAGILILVPLWLAWPVAARSWSLHRAANRPLALPHAQGMQVGLASIADSKLEDVEALVAYLQRRPQGPLLLLGGDVMLYTVSDRVPLRPEHEYAIYNVVLDMLPLRELAALDDGGWGPALEARPDTAVVWIRDPGGARVLAALPSLKAHLDQHYTATRRIGRYQVFELPSAAGSASGSSSGSEFMPPSDLRTAK